MVVASILASGCVTRSVCSNLLTVVLSQSQGTKFGVKKHGQGSKANTPSGATSQSNGNELCEIYLGIILASIPLYLELQLCFSTKPLPLFKL